MSLTLLADCAPYILILGGVTAASWLLEKIMRPTPIVGEPISWLVKVMSAFGFLVGVLMMATAAVVWSANGVLDTGSKYLLIVTALALLLKPIRDIPWAALIGLLVGGVCAAYVFFFLPLPETVFGISSKWIYIVVFLVPALVVYLLFKFVEDLLRLVGSILASRPVAIILGLVCIAQGVLLIFNESLFTILF